MGSCERRQNDKKKYCHNLEKPKDLTTTNESLAPELERKHPVKMHRPNLPPKPKEQPPTPPRSLQGQKKQKKRKRRERMRRTKTKTKTQPESTQRNKFFGLYVGLCTIVYSLLVAVHGAFQYRSTPGTCRQ